MDQHEPIPMIPPEMLTELLGQIENIDINALSQRDAILLQEMQRMINWLRQFNKLLKALSMMIRVIDKSQACHRIITNFIDNSKKQSQRQSQRQVSYEETYTGGDYDDGDDANNDCDKENNYSTDDCHRESNYDTGDNYDEQDHFDRESNVTAKNNFDSEKSQSDLWFVPLNDADSSNNTNVENVLASRQPSLLQRLQRRRNYIIQRRKQRINCNAAHQSSHLDASKKGQQATAVRSASAFPWLCNYIGENNSNQRRTSQKNNNLPSTSTSASPPSYTNCNCHCCYCDECASTPCSSCASPGNNFAFNEMTHIFTHSQMRRQTEKMYSKLPEVKEQQEKAKIEQTKRTAHILRKIYTSKVKEQTLRGKTDFPITQNFLIH